MLILRNDIFSGDLFGLSVAFSDDRALIGSYCSDKKGNIYSGT